jgi:hypothetical protein
MRTGLAVGSDSSQTDSREIVGFKGERQAHSRNMAVFRSLAIKEQFFGP